MTVMDQLGSSIGSMLWGSMGQIVFYITLMLLIIVLSFMLWFFFWYKTFIIPVRIYEPYGQVQLTDKEIAEVQEVKDGKVSIDISKLGQKGIKFDMLKSRKTKGKHISIKGTPYFQIFSPIKKIQSIPLELLFDNGVHLLRLSKDIFVPMQKPKMIIEVGENVSISIVENNTWLLWNNMMAERINAKYTSIEESKRMTLYFVVGIVAMVLIGAFILWLIYSSVSKGIPLADKVNQYLATATKSGVPPT
jgi:hypothetical protein